MKVIIEDDNWDDMETEIETLLKEYETTVSAGLNIFEDGSQWLHYYNHQSIKNKMSEQFKKRLQTTIDRMMNNPEIQWNLFDAWINFIEPNLSKIEPFHRDINKDVVLVHYPKFNKEIKGGEFQWVENENTPQQEVKSIKPQAGTGTNVLLLECPQHRVTSVTEGIRWSFVFFCHKRKDKHFL